MSRTLQILLAYAGLSAVYLLYLPHALPVLDDWIHLQWFDRARIGGIGGELDFLRRLIDNTWISEFRIFWTSFIPTFALSLVAGFTAWPYFLLAWMAHLATAVLLSKTVSLLVNDHATGFSAGAIYAVFPACNSPLFWPISTCFYYLGSLALAWWFYRTWNKLALREDYRFGWKELALLFVVVFSGQQILPALLLLLPVSYWLWGKPQHRRDFLRFWLLHAAAMAVLLGVYAFFVNRLPLARAFQERYGGSGYANVFSFAFRLLASLSLRPDFAEWRPAWRLDATLIVLVVVAAMAFFWGARQVERRRTRIVQGKLLVWSLAGVALTYLPLALLPGMEWRYLYVPATFLVAAGVALLALLPRRVGAALAFLAVAYGLTLSYFEMRQSWIPQSREARAILETVASAKPMEQGDVLILSRALYAIGPAPSFIAGAGWSLKAMLEHSTGVAGVRGARELLVNENGELALYNKDRIDPFPRSDLNRLRVFVRQPDGRFVPKPSLALPVSGGRFRLIPLERGAAPLEPLSREELQRLPFFHDIYFAHPHRGPLPHA